MQDRALTSEMRYQRYADYLDQLKQQTRYRAFKSIEHQGPMIRCDEKSSNASALLLNLSSNDYLGINQQTQFQEQFFDEYPVASHYLSSSSSRLLTGNFEEHQRLETALSKAFGRSSLLFNSGYHMNVGLLPALTDARSLIISDELIHASIIDGIRLSKAQRQRYLHQNLIELQRLVEVAQQRCDIDQIFIVTESIFSMDGDVTDLQALVALKHAHDKVILYVDDAHGIGVYGKVGLGCAEAQNCLLDIDILLGTFGKALASQGGYVICSSMLRDYLINTVRPLIFSTALPPLNLAWTCFIFEQIQSMDQQRQHLADLSQRIISAIHAKQRQCPSQSHIVPIIYGENTLAVSKAQHMQQQGFYVLPIRPPTVAIGSARVRICLNANLRWDDLEPLVELI